MRRWSAMLPLLAIGTAWAVLPVPVTAAEPAQGSMIAQPDGVEVSLGKIRLRVKALTDQILRIRIAPDDIFGEDASWAVSAAVRGEHVKVTPQPDGFSTPSFRLRINPETLKMTVEDKRGNIILRDENAPVDFDGKAFTLRKTMQQSEKYYGLGDKTGPANRRGASYVNWNTDAYGFGATTDPIYKSIPFFVSLGGAGGSYGLFLDNSWRSWFDFGHREDGVLQFGSSGGPIDYYLIAGPSTADVARHYTDLTGKAPLPPKWAFGYQQSRYSYMSDTEVRDLVTRLRSEKIPTDVVWLDIDFQDRNRPFTANAKSFPDIAKLAADMGKTGIKLVAITDLHVAAAPGQGYAPYESGVAGKHFLRKADGSIYVAPVWPGPSVFPDFTDKDARAWWGSLYKGFAKEGVAGFWNDMNEPAIFETPTKTMPLDNIHHIDSDDFAARDASHAELHNVYGLENTRATFDGLKAIDPDSRPFVMTRATYAGGQKYALTWTGDNSSTWEHLKLSVQQLLNLGLSGFSYTGADVGGFTGGASPELLTRWMQIAAFTPVFRVHAANTAPRSEPWVDGPEHLALRRTAIEERYRLLPYIYAAADQNARTGDPIMRPVFYDYPELANASCDQSIAFTLGHDLLIAPSPKPESPQPYQVCLPKGGWFDYWTGQKRDADMDGSHDDFDVTTETPALGKLPVFVRAGAIIPHQPLVQSTSETPNGPLTLDIYPGKDCRGDLYADDGLTTAYVRGAYLRQTVRCTLGKDGIGFSIEKREGNYTPWWREISFAIHGWHGGAKLNGTVSQTQPILEGDTLRFTLPDQRDALSFTVSRN